MSTKDFGCFFCNGKSTDRDGRCEECDNPINISAELSQITLSTGRIEKVLGRGFYGWTAATANETGMAYAVKIIPVRRIASGPAPNEVKNLAKVSHHRNIARLYFSREEDLHLNNETIRCLLLHFEHIENAETLNKFLASPKEDLRQQDIIDLAKGLASALERLDNVQLWHHDLHDDNVLVRKIAADENLPEKYEVKLIDFGSAIIKMPGSQEPNQSKNDYFYLAKHIGNLADLYDRSCNIASPADRYFVTSLKSLAHRISDDDVSRRSLTPSDIVTELTNTLHSSTLPVDKPGFEQMIDHKDVSLSDPLSNTNALQMQPQDISLLFVDGLHWKNRLMKSEAVMILGPRGCGKTMLLRYFSLTSQARPRRNETTVEQVRDRLATNPYIGFHLHISSVRPALLRSFFEKLCILDEPCAEEFVREYFNSYFLIEVTQALQWLSTEQLTKFSANELTDFATTLRGVCGSKFSSSRDLPSLELALQRHALELSMLSSPTDYSPSVLAGADILIKAAQIIKRIPAYANKEIWFLLDDYSTTVVPRTVETAYNPIIFNSSPDVRMKFSSEGDGPLQNDRLGRKYKEGRDFTRVNLGEIYFEADESTGRKFVEAVLEQRFQESRIGSVEQVKRMLGNHDNFKGFGKYMLQRKRMGTSMFYGFDLICSLCSGDISYIIELLHTLIRTEDLKDSSEKTINKKSQDQIIKRFAQRQLASLKDVATHGNRLYTFAECLGSAMRTYLANSPNKEKPDERLRIEVEGNEELSAGATEFLHELLRHSVLVSGGSGKSQRGLPTRKYYFRRLFAPCFPFSPKISGCIAGEISDFEQWLSDPNSFMPQASEKCTETGEKGSNRHSTNELGLEFTDSDPKELER